MRSLFIVLVPLGAILRISGTGTAQESSSGTPNSSRTAIAGTWDATVRSHGGIGSTVIFSTDSAFALVLGAMVDMTYKVVGDKFTFFSSEPGDQSSETQDLKFVSGQAVLSGHGCSRKLTRLDPQAGDSGLVGKWRSIHMTGVPAYEEYTADGITRLRVPIQVQRGVFHVTDSTINFQTLSPRREAWSAGFRLSGDTLTFSIGGEQKRYVRARPLIPLDVQQPMTIDRNALCPRR